MYHFQYVGEEVSMRGNCDLPMAECNHEEADTRMVVHVDHAVTDGATHIQVRTVDTDVVVILTGLLHHLLVINPEVVIHIAFGTGKNYTVYNINSIWRQMGELKSKCLPVFHAFTGCDTTSAFHGKGKKSAWQKWQDFDSVTTAFAYIAQNEFCQLDADTECFKILENFTVQMYESKSDASSVNEIRKVLFCQKNRPVQLLPPTQVCSIDSNLTYFITMY